MLLNKSKSGLREGLKVKVLVSLSVVSNSVTPRTVAHQAPAAAAAAKSLQSCPTLCDSIDGSPPGSPVPGILQARTLQWVAISFSKAWKWKVKVKLLSRVRLLVTPWTAAHQAPPSMGFSREEYWSGVPLPSPMSLEFSRQEDRSGLSFPSSGDLPIPGIKPKFSALQVDSLLSKTPRSPR